MRQTPDQSGGILGKAIVLVFLAVFTLGSAGMAIAFLGVGSGMGGMPFGGAPRFMAVVPVGFVVIGVLMFIKMAATPAGAVGNSQMGMDQSAQAATPPLPPAPTGPLACPGCGSRKNLPGVLTCAYCGGTLASRAV